MASIAAILGFYGQANYAAPKSGVEAMMRVICREAARRGIRANCISSLCVGGGMEIAMAIERP